MSGTGAARKAAASAGKAATSAGKAALGKAAIGKAAFAGGSLVALAGRRALWPAFFIGSCFSSAAWFGTFELTWSAMRFMMPIPTEPDQTARNTGLLTLPVTTGGSFFLGYKLCPPMAVPPESVVDISGFLSYGRSFPLKHIALVGGASAVMAAVTCRCVQFRGGA